MKNEINNNIIMQEFIEQNYKTPNLIKKIFERDPKIINSLIDVESNEFAGCKFTFLQLAVCKKNQQIIKILLESPNIDPDVPDENGYTAFIWAVYGGDKEIVKIFLNCPKKIDFGAKDKSGKTAYDWAVGEGHQEIAKKMLLSKKLLTQRQNNIEDENDYGFIMMDDEQQVNNKNYQYELIEGEDGFVLIDNKDSKDSKNDRPNSQPNIFANDNKDESINKTKTTKTTIEKI